MEPASIHTSQHVMLEQLIKRTCGYQVEIIQQAKYQVFDDGTGRGVEFRVECPADGVTVTLPPRQSLTFSFSHPTTRQNGEPLSCDEIVTYQLKVDGFYPGELSAQMSTCSAEGCGQFSTEILHTVE